VVRRTGESEGDEVAIFGVRMSLPWNPIYQRCIFAVYFPGTLYKFLIPRVDSCGQRGEGGGVYKGINRQRSGDGSRHGDRLKKQVSYAVPFILLLIGSGRPFLCTHDSSVAIPVVSGRQLIPVDR
jgi:hypothetical protein